MPLIKRNQTFKFDILIQIQFLLIFWGNKSASANITSISKSSIITNRKYDNISLTVWEKDWGRIKNSCFEGNWYHKTL